MVIIVWLIDFISTMYFIHNGSGITEANPIPRLFFNNGLHSLYFLVIILFFYTLIIQFPKIYDSWDEELPGEYQRLFRWTISGIIIGMESATIFGNMITLGWF